MDALTPPTPAGTLPRETAPDAPLFGRCAWCYADAHIPWPHGVSSTICQAHLALERAKAAACRAAQQQAGHTVV
jgi:hypothetical protein